MCVYVGVHVCMFLHVFVVCVYMHTCVWVPAKIQRGIISLGTKVSGICESPIMDAGI